MDADRMSATEDLGAVWEMVVKFRKVLIAGLLASVFVGPTPQWGSTALAAGAAGPAITPDVRGALAQMGITLEAKEFAFQARTIRMYRDESGQPLHVFDTFKVTVRRPDRLAVDVVGDDERIKVFYDGKALVLVLPDQKQFPNIPVPDTIQGMMQVAMGHFEVDLPLSDFLTDVPDKAFLTGVTTGREADTAMIDGTLCRHLVFFEPPGVQLELWLEKNDRSLPRRLIVSYHDLPGQPVFIAEMSDWNFAVHPSDGEFVYQPPAGMERLQLIPTMSNTGGRQ